MWRNAFEPWHLVILVLVVVVVFGWKKLPDAARSLGRSARIFKAEIGEMKQDEKRPSAAARDTVDGERVTRTETTVSHETPASGGQAERVREETVVEETREGTSTGSTRAPGA